MLNGPLRNTEHEKARGPRPARDGSREHRANLHRGAQISILAWTNNPEVEASVGRSPAAHVGWPHAAMPRHG